MSESERDEVTEAYRRGYVAGYSDGTVDGRMQGYEDARQRAYRAVGDDPEAAAALSHYVGER